MKQCIAKVNTHALLSMMKNWLTITQSCINLHHVLGQIYLKRYENSALNIYTDVEYLLSKNYETLS